MSLTGPTHKDHYFSKDGFGLKQEEYVKKLKDENKWDESQIKNEGAI